MRIAIITVAGMSSRFNQGVAETSKCLKAIYYADDKEKTLLFHLLKKCTSIDKIILVGGYKFNDLQKYIATLDNNLRNKIILVYNDSYEKYGSGYSLYLGLKEAFSHKVNEIYFMEGDLDFDEESFSKIIKTNKNILTYNFEPIYANKAVVLYKNENNQFKYAFNSNHGMLTISCPFSCILNSGQVWKFLDMDMLNKANELFFEKDRTESNLKIIQNYLDFGIEAELIPLKRWTNCNTKKDYEMISSYWEEE